MKFLDRFVPRSLFSRLVLVLLAGLIVAQLISFGIHMRDRGQALAEASGVQSAQRIADIVRLLDPLTPTERARIVQVLNAPPLIVKLGSGRARTLEADEESPLAIMFGNVLRRYLGDNHRVVVNVVELAPVAYPVHRPGHNQGMPGFRGGEGAEPNPNVPPAVRRVVRARMSFLAEVSLLDGSVVTFDSRQPALPEGWSYRLLLSLALSLIAVIVVSLIVVRSATRPLKVLADAAEELGRNLHRPPLSEAGPVEVARAAHTFNTMQSRLVGYLRERTQMLAAMSHDLKTPITRLRLRAELLDDEILRTKFAADLQEMESMVSAALDFLRGIDSSEAPQPVDIAALLDSLQADLRETGGQVEVQATPLQPYVGRPQALKRCLSNLLENAVKYGGSAEVRTVDAADALEIHVLDSGPGLPDKELERVFEPFYRVDASRNRDTGGTGLGLSIARSVALAHGGSLTLTNRAEGGLRAVLHLPRGLKTS